MFDSNDHNREILRFYKFFFDVPDCISIAWRPIWEEVLHPIAGDDDNAEIDCA